MQDQVPQVVRKNTVLRHQPVQLIDQGAAVRSSSGGERGQDQCAASGVLVPDRRCDEDAVALLYADREALDVTVDVLEASLALQTVQGIADVLEAHQEVVHDDGAVTLRDAGHEMGRHVGLQDQRL